MNQTLQRIRETAEGGTNSRHTSQGTATTL